MARQRTNIKKEPTAAPAATATTVRPNRVINMGSGWLSGLLVAVLVLLVFLAGIAVADHHRGRVFGAGNMVKRSGLAGGFGLRRHGFGGQAARDGQTRLNGVVTSVSGSGFTVAGHGSTTNVTTNSSTQYQGGNQVKQNDSVIVRGSQSNGTITATEVAINP